MTVPEAVYVRRAKHVKDYALRLYFSDDTQRVVDFGPFLSRSSNPQIRVFVDPGKFATFRVNDGDLVWGDWELCFPIADLYLGRI